MRDLGVAFFLAANAGAFVVALFLLFCRKYEEGLTGNVALSALAVASAITLWDAMHGRLELPSPLYCLLIVALVGVLMRHAYRFAMFHWHGHFGWKPPADMARTRAADAQ